MGITGQGLDFLLSAKREGVDFTRTMTIGRQFLLVPVETLPAALPIGGDEWDRLRDQLEGDPGFADPLLRHLGADELSSIDGSAFEGASYVHDLNTPLGPELFRRFSVVLDGGCLEHVFDFPTAIRSCMQMVEVGGHLLCMPPVNNAAGHGFYQFSPELYFRVLSPENGFVVERMLLAEVRPDATWYRVVDPATAGRRIEFTTRRQAYLYVQARRVDDRPPLSAPPVQSDYHDLWRREAEPADEPPAPEGRGPLPILEMARRAFRRTPVLHVPVRRLRRELAEHRQRRHPYDPRHFQPLGRRLR